MDLAHLTAFARRSRASLVALGVCLRGPDRAADYVWRQEWTMARNLGLPVSTHIASDRAAAAKGGIDLLARADLLGPDTLMVHATHASEQQMRLMAIARSPLSLSPWTELAVGYGLPPIAKLADAGIPLGLSVDNVVRAGQVDMFAVMRLTADLASGMSERQQSISEETVLGWATREGAKALGLGDRIGTLEPGKRADLILVDARSRNMIAASEPVTAVVRTARPSDLRLVLVDGVIRMTNGVPPGVDAIELRSQAAESTSRLRALAGL